MKEFIANLKAKLVKIHKSMTAWFNTSVATLVPVVMQAQDQFPQLRDYLPANLYKHAFVVLVVGNILLRFKTTKSLADK